MDGAGGKFEMRSAHVGRELDHGAAFLQSDGQCFGWKQMTAGSAGCQQHQRRGGRHQAALSAFTNFREFSMCARGFSRVSASSMPIA